MNERIQDYLADIHTWVWSGFYTAGELEELLAEQLEDEEEALDALQLQAALAKELDAKQKAEAEWPNVTDCDRLDQAFAMLEKQPIIALQNAGYTISDGLDEVDEVLAQSKQTATLGYCFYHGQDLARAIEGAGLWLAFGSFDDDANHKQAVGKLVQDALNKAGLIVEWDENPEARIKVPYFDWKRRNYSWL